jgi:signal transduction histidine kinase
VPELGRDRRPRRGRLRARMARYIAFAVVVTLVAGMTSTILYRHLSMRAALEDSARRFAALAGVPLTQMADMHSGAAGGRHLETMIERLFEVNQDVERLEVVSESGSVAFTATRDRLIPGGESWRLPESSALLGRGIGPAVTAGRVRADGHTVYQVVVPSRQVGEPSAFSLVATFSYRNLNRQLQRALLFAGLALVLGLLIAHRVSTALARGITHNLEVLQQGVRKLRSGHLEDRVDLHSGDEIEELADAFNDMAGELDRTITRLRAANLELHTLDQMKADLVANVSHELRTPLTALKGYLELLDEGGLGPLSDEARRSVAVCRKNADRLAVRVEDLVQLSQIEKAWPSLWAFEPVRLQELVEAVAETFEMRIRDKRLRVALDIPPELPMVSGNAEQLERVVLNLLDNAIKFTPDGGDVAVAAEECDHDGREGVLLRVLDSGIGIPESELVRIFDRFHQVDTSIRRRYGGMGLGLSLVQRIVDSHRGVVWAESGGTEGSVFSAWLPRSPPDDPDA